MTVRDRVARAIVRGMATTIPVAVAVAVAVAIPVAVAVAVAIRLMEPPIGQSSGVDRRGDDPRLAREALARLHHRGSQLVGGHRETENGGRSHPGGFAGPPRGSGRERGG